MGAGIIVEIARRDEDSELVYIAASHPFSDSIIKIGFRRSRHISAYQFDFLHMVAPHIERESIKKLAWSRTPAEREKLLESAMVPDFREMRNSLKASRVVGLTQA